MGKYYIHAYGFDFEEHHFKNFVVETDSIEMFLKKEFSGGWFENYIGEALKNIVATDMGCKWLIELIIRECTDEEFEVLKRFIEHKGV